VHGKSQASKEHKHANKGKKAKTKKVVKKPRRVPHHHMIVLLLKIAKEEEAKVKRIQAITT